MNNVNLEAVHEKKRIIIMLQGQNAERQDGRYYTSYNHALNLSSCNWNGIWGRRKKGAGTWRRDSTVKNNAN